MPGTGPPPKDPSLRQRRNRTSTRSVLPALPDRPRGEIPPLPSIGHRKWHPDVERWWSLLWTSPIASKIPASEVPSLEMVAILRNDFHRASNPKDRARVLSEIRLQERRWGLDEMSRRGLQWEFERPGDTGTPAPQAPPPPDADDDPRKVLRMVR